MLKDSLIELAESKEIIHVIVASTDGDRIESYGDINKLKYNSIGI
ncbi:hypothetical protein [Pontibacillus sp. HMF3514]|nr:hypothetical protein [Pontibacillus sp. HMF3514]